MYLKKVIYIYTYYPYIYVPPVFLFTVNLAAFFRAQEGHGFRPAGGAMIHLMAITDIYRW